MDLFFFVTTLAVILITACAAVVLWRFARILENIEHISGQVAHEGDAIRRDLAHMRVSIKRGKGRLKSLFNFLGITAKRAPKKT